MSWGEQLLVKVVKENRVKDFTELSDQLFVKHEKDIHSFIKNHLEQYDQLPSFALLKKKKKVRDDFPDDPYSLLLSEVRNRTLFNDFQDLYNQISKMLDKRDMQKCVKHVTSFIESKKISMLVGTQNLTTMQEMGKRLLKDILETRASAGLTGVPTGWSTLDEQTGGFQKGDLYVILARPKMGKTISMLHMSEQAHRQGFVPLFISMEMKEMPIAKRYFAKRAGLNMTTMKTGALSTYAYKRLHRAVSSYQKELPFYFIEGQFKKQIDEIARLVQSLAPHVVYIDGAYLVKLAQYQRMAKWEQMTEIAEMLKTIAVQSSIPVVVSFQFTRQVKGTATDAGFEHIQLSDAIGQLASVGIGIFPSDNESSSEDSIQRKIKIVGGREGEEGTFYINWRWDVMDFSEITTHNERSLNND